MPLGQRAAFPPEFIQKIPEFALAQWELAPMLKAGIWPSPFKAPGKHGLGLIRWGAGTASTPQEVYWKRMEGVTHHTISSNLRIGNVWRTRPTVQCELNYLIFRHWLSTAMILMNSSFQRPVSMGRRSSPQARRSSSS
jgi:hypothetical protein